MAEKKRNEILEEQRKARQEFLNLKKMQQGEMYAGPKPSETATILKTPKDKFKNFWHYSKWLVISGIALAVLIAVMVVQCVQRPVYDLKVVYFTYDAVLDEQISPIADYLKEYCDDINGDGEKNIQIINCSISQNSGVTAIRNTTYQKLQSIIVAEKNAMLFITDKNSIKYFDNLDGGSNSIFDENKVLLSDDFYEKTKNETFGSLPDELTLSCRKISNTTIEKKDESVTYYKAAQKIINSIKNK